MLLDGSLFFRCAGPGINGCLEAAAWLVWGGSDYYAAGGGAAELASSSPSLLLVILLTRIKKRQG